LEETLNPAQSINRVCSLIFIAAIYQAQALSSPYDIETVKIGHSNTVAILADF